MKGYGLEYVPKPFVITGATVVDIGPHGPSSVLVFRSFQHLIFSAIKDGGATGGVLIKAKGVWLFPNINTDIINAINTLVNFTKCSIKSFG
jgi:hypothetical protein